MSKAIVFVVLFLFAFSTFATATQRIPIAFSQGTQNSPWPEFQQNSFHTGGSPLVGPSSNLTKWKVTSGGYVEGTPALSQDGSTVYFGTTSGYLFAADANSGAIKWKAQAGGYSFDSSPAVSAN